MAKRQSSTSSTSGTSTSTSTAPAAVAAPVAPVPVPLPNPGLPLASELWHGVIGRCVVAGDEVGGRGGHVITLSRWVLHTHALQTPDRLKISTASGLQKVHARLVKEAGEDPSEHPAIFEAGNTARARAIRACLDAAPGTWPFRRTDVVVADLDAANEHGLGGEFFRVYVSTDPAAPGLTLLPDILALNVGDPALVWPAVTAGYLTDGQWAAIAPAAPDVIERAAGTLRELAAAAGLV